MQNQTTQQPGDKVARLRATFQHLETQLNSVLIGQHEIVRLLLTGVVSGGHMLVIGVPGLAKTMMVKALSDLLGWEFRRIQFTTGFASNQLRVAIARRVIGRELSQNPDILLVILDLAMPRMSGVDTMQEIRKIKPGLPIVLCSGSLTMSDPSAARYLQGSTVPEARICKPYDVGELTGTVRRVLDKKPHTSEAKP